VINGIGTLPLLCLAPPLTTEDLSKVALDLPTGQIINARPSAGGIASAIGLGGSFPTGVMLSSVTSRNAAVFVFPQGKL